MITRQIPKVPDLPPDPEGAGMAFEADLHRCVVMLHDSAVSRGRMLSTLRDYEVTSTPNRRRHLAMGRFSGLHSGLAYPWRFNVSTDGNSWWPSESRAIAASGSGEGDRGALGAIYEPITDGQLFDTLGPENRVPLSPGARSFWIKVPMSLVDEYHPGDTFRPGIPAGSIEVINLALGDLPAESQTTIFVPWVDVPPAAPPAPRIPSYHFALWFRFSHYWRPVEEPSVPSGSSSSSSSSGSSSRGSSSSSGSGPSAPSHSSSGKPIVL